MKAKANNAYVISVEYNIGEDGFALDDVLNKIAGQKSGSSGCWLASKPAVRDIQWYFSSKEKADAVFKKMKEIKGIEVAMRKDEDD
jgi:hypothetical protein